MIRFIIFIIICVILYVPAYETVKDYLSRRPSEEKLGYIPQKDILRMLSMNHKSLISEFLFLKTIIYYGSIFEKSTKIKKALRNIEYDNIYNFLDASTYIDPYNIDSYYFVQALFPWDTGRIKDVNKLLLRGLEYRTWDFYIPFFLAFNNFYFLKDYKEASRYMEIAARIKREPLLINLAARFLYESDATEIAIAFLKTMIENTWNPKTKKILETRLYALQAVHYIETGIKIFKDKYHRLPYNINELIYKGIIKQIPNDPYGGDFYIDKNGKVRSTSEFTFRLRHGNSNKN